MPVQASNAEAMAHPVMPEQADQVVHADRAKVDREVRVRVDRVKEVLADRVRVAAMVQDRAEAMEPSAVDRSSKVKAAAGVVRKVAVSAHKVAVTVVRKVAVVTVARKRADTVVHSSSTAAVCERCPVARKAAVMVALKVKVVHKAAVARRVAVTAVHKVVEAMAVREAATVVRRVAATVALRAVVVASDHPVAVGGARKVVVVVVRRDVRVVSLAMTSVSHRPVDSASRYVARSFIRRTPVQAGRAVVDRNVRRTRTSATAKVAGSPRGNQKASENHRMHLL